MDIYLKLQVNNMSPEEATESFGKFFRSGVTRALLNECMIDVNKNNVVVTNIPPDPRADRLDSIADRMETMNFAMTSVLDTCLGNLVGTASNVTPAPPAAILDQLEPSFGTQVSNYLATHEVSMAKFSKATTISVSTLYKVKNDQEVSEDTVERVKKYMTDNP